MQRSRTHRPGRGSARPSNPEPEHGEAVVPSKRVRSTATTSGSRGGSRVVERMIYRLSRSRCRRDRRCRRRRGYRCRTRGPRGPRPNETCGTCRYCREGPENLCENFSLYHGGLTEAARVQADRLVRLPDGVEPVDAAALPTAYMTAFHMLRRVDAGPGDRCLSRASPAVSASQACNSRPFSALTASGPRLQRRS